MLLQAARFSYLGLFFGIAVLIGYGGGAWLDRRFHTGPWLSIVGVLLGIASSFKELYRLASQHSRAQRSENERNENKSNEKDSE